MVELERVIEHRLGLSVRMRHDGVHVHTEQVHVRAPALDGDGRTRVVQAGTGELADLTRGHTREAVEVLRPEERETADVRATAGRNGTELYDGAVRGRCTGAVVVMPLDHDLAARRELQAHLVAEHGVAATDCPSADELGALA